jgi:predicted RND superfamily exporter protein
LNNFFRRQFRLTGKRKESIAYAFEQTGWSILFAALTTISGLLAFMTVPIQTIRWVGGAAGASIGLVLFFFFFFYPAVLAIGRDRKPQPDYQEKEAGFANRFFGGLGNWIHNHHLVIMIVLVGVTLLSCFGISRVRVDLNTFKMLGDRLPNMKEQMYVANSKLGMWNYYELALHFEGRQQAIDAEVLKKLDSFVAEINRLPLVKRTGSLLDTVKEVYRVRNNSDPAYYVVPDNTSTIRGMLMLYERTAGAGLHMWVDKEYKTLRVQVELSEFSSQEMTKQVKFIDEKLKTYFPASEYPGFEYWLAGNSIQLSIMNQYVTTGLISSVAVASLVIAILMIIVLGSVKLGLIAMIPNIIPLLVAGGVMGFLGTPLEFVTMTIAPMVLGLTVDGTIYFTNRARMEYMASGDYDLALSQTFKKLGIALFETAFIICIAFSAFLFARVNNINNMGIYTIISISAALIANFFVTPVLMKIIKPFGQAARKKEA